MRAGRIQVSDVTHALLEDPRLDDARTGDLWEPTGGVEVKGKGHMLTFLWEQPSGFLHQAVNPAAFRPAALSGPVSSRSSGDFME